MINPGTYNIVCPQGATFDRTFTIRISNALLNLTGYTAAMQVRGSYNSSEPLISLTNGNGITLGGAAGTVAIIISATTTAGVPAGTYSYDLEIASGGVVTRLLEGSFKVTDNITR